MKFAVFISQHREAYLLQEALELLKCVMRFPTDFDRVETGAAMDEIGKGIGMAW